MGGTQGTPQILPWRKASMSHMFDSLMRMVFFVAGVDNKDAHDMLA